MAQRATSCVIAALLSVQFVLGGTAGAEGLVESIGPIGITVSDLERSVAFYRDVLDFEPVGEPVEVAGDDWERLFAVFGLRVRVQRMRLGRETIELIDFLAPEGRPNPVDARSNDGWFQHIAIITSDMEQAYARLRKHRVEHASSGPQTLPDWNPNAGGITAFYFKDPDRNVLEVLEFPPDKGDARWQAPEPLFLGIDHTAIVVADTDESLAFYRDRLGLAIGGESENWGIEQERLNSVFGARLRITALRAPSGPGIELLEYLAPSDGRPMPEGTRANDLWHWQTRLEVRDGAEALSADHVSWVSPGFVDIEPDELGIDAAQMVRDSDGHALLLVR